MDILNVRIDNFSRKEILEKIENFLFEEKFHQVVTVNPEFVLLAQEDKEFRAVLNAADLNVADGIGIGYAFLRYGRLLKARFAGADLLHEICYLAYVHNLRIFLALNRKSLCTFAEIKKLLEERYPTIQIEGGEFDPELAAPKAAIDCEILLCAFGAPWQEKFIRSQKNGTIRLALGVGGSFDFLTGKLPRAPKIMRILGLEWLWRFILEPKYRAKRIWHAIAVFPWKVLINR